MTTGLIVVLAVLVLGTGTGLWRRRTDGTFRSVDDRGGPVLAGAHVPSGPVPASADVVPAHVDGTPRRIESVLSSGFAPAGPSGSVDPSPGAAPDPAGPSGSASGRSSGEPVGASAGQRAAGEDGTLPIAGAHQAGADDAPVGGLDADLLARLGVGPARATLLQFSTAFCAPCRAVRRVSGEVAAMVPGVQHVEIDAESHLDVVRQLGIWRTPTLLVLDAGGREVKRATGVPGKPQLIAVLGQVLGD